MTYNSDTASMIWMVAYYKKTIYFITLIKIIIKFNNIN